MVHVKIKYICLHFLLDLRQTWTFTFPKVVKQPAYGVWQLSEIVILDILFF